MNRIDAALHFHQSALNLRAARQAVIASNIANADTPNYKARDMDFRAALSGALAGRSGAMGVTTSAARHIGGAGLATSPFLQYRTETQSSVDGNTVDMDTERAAMAQNSLYYEASLGFVNSFFSGMRLAITGQ